MIVKNIESLFMIYIYVNVYNLIGVKLVIVDILNFKID